MIEASIQLVNLDLRWCNIDTNWSTFSVPKEIGQIGKENNERKRRWMVVCDGKVAKSNPIRMTDGMEWKGRLLQVARCWGRYH